MEEEEEGRMVVESRAERPYGEIREPLAVRYFLVGPSWSGLGTGRHDSHGVTEAIGNGPEAPPAPPSRESGQPILGLPLTRTSHFIAFFAKTGVDR